MRLSKKRLKYIRRHAARKSPEEIAKALDVPLKVVQEALPARRDVPESEPPDDAGLPEEREASFLALAAPFLERAPYWGVFALVVAIPFLVVPGLRDYSNLPKSVFAQLGALAVTFVWLVGSGIRKDCRLARTSLDLPLLAFIGWASLSLLWGHNTYEALLVWSRWAAAGLVFLLTVNVVRDRRDARVLLWGLLGSATVVAIVGNWQYLLEIGRNPPPFPPGFLDTIRHLIELRWIPQSLSPAATFGNPNFAAQYVVLVMPLGAGLFLTARTRAGEWLAAFACSLMGVYLLNTSTKACWVAVGVGAAFVAALLLRERLKLGARFLTDRVESGSSGKANRRDRAASGSSREAARRGGKSGPFEGPACPNGRGRRWNRTAALVSAAVFALVLANLTPKGFRWRLGRLYGQMSVLWHKPDDAGKDMTGPAPTQSDAEYRSSIHYRFLLWGNTLEMIKDHPVLGVGIGNWRVRYVGYSSKFALDKGVTSRRQPGRAHNDHLQVLAELGLVGAALYLWLGYAIYRAVVRALARGTDRPTRYLAMAVAAGVLGILVDASFSLPFQLAVPPLIVMVYLAILGGVLAPSPPAREQDDAEPSRGALPPGPVRLPVRAFYSAAAVVAILFVVHALMQLCRIRADWHFRRMDFASVKGNWKTVVVEGEKASKYDPRRKKTLVTVAGGHIRLARSDKTTKAKRGRLERAAAMLKEVVRAYPCNLKAYNHLGVAYMEIAELERKASPARFKSALGTSLAYFKSALAVRPEYADVHCNLASVYDKLGKRDEAVASLGRALWYDPQNPMLLKNMAIAWTKRKDLGKALFHYKRAVEVRSFLFSADLSLRSDLVSGRLSGPFLQKFKGRRVSLSKNIAISREKEAGPWLISDLGKGRTYFAEETGKALKVYARKDNASVYGAMAGIHMSRGEVPEALRNYRLAAKLAPQNATYQHELGVSAFRARRYRDARAAFQDTLRLKPGWALAHKNLGMVQIGFLGEKSEGIRHLKAALRLNPKVAGAAKVRDLLKRYGAAP